MKKFMWVIAVCLALLVSTVSAGTRGILPKPRPYPGVVSDGAGGIEVTGQVKAGAVLIGTVNPATLTGDGAGGLLIGGNPIGAGAPGVDGDSAYVYVAYASADDGTGFTTTFNATLDYIAILATDTEIAEPAVGDFAGLWTKYQGSDGNDGDPGTPGEDAAEIELQTNATHVQWRRVGGEWADLIALSAITGQDATNIELQVTATHIQWRLIGGEWADLLALSELAGDPGTPGANAFVYIAYASDASGTGFTTTFDADLDYIAILSTDTEIPSPAVGDFAGLWKNYKGAPGDPGTGIPSQADCSSTEDGFCIDSDNGTLYYYVSSALVFTLTPTGGITLAKQSGVAGDIALLEANSTDLHTAGFRGPDSITGDGAYRLKFPNARPASANIVMACSNVAESGTGTAADPYVLTCIWLDLDNYQAADADLDIWATVTPSANGQSLVAMANYATMFGSLKQASTEGATGVVELATQTEVNAGSDTGRAVTPDTLSGSIYGQKEIGWSVYDSDVDTAVADGKQAATIPASMNGMNLVDVTCSVASVTGATSGATTIVLRRVRGATAADMTSTGVTIDYNAYTASDETVDTSNDDVATGDKIYVDVNGVSGGAAAKGLSCTAVFQMP